MRRIGYYENGGEGENWLLCLPASLFIWIFLSTLPANVAISLLCARKEQVISTKTCFITLLVWLLLHYAFLPGGIDILRPVMAVCGVLLSIGSFLLIRQHQQEVEEALHEGGDLE